METFKDWIVIKTTNSNEDLLVNYNKNTKEFRFSIKKVIKDKTLMSMPIIIRHLLDLKQLQLNLEKVMSNTYRINSIWLYEMGMKKQNILFNKVSNHNDITQELLIIELYDETHANSSNKIIIDKANAKNLYRAISLTINSIN